MLLRMTTTVSGSQEVEVVSCDVGRRVKAGKGGIFVICYLNLLGQRIDQKCHQCVIYQRSGSFWVGGNNQQPTIFAHNKLPFSPPS